MTLSVKSEISGLFVNPFAPIAKYSRHSTANLPQLIFKCIYLKNQKNFPNILSHFQNLHEIF